MRRRVDRIPGDLAEAGEGGVNRIVAQVSCGAASACAWKLAVDRFGDRVVGVNAFVADEDPDNRRFLADVERWVGRPCIVLRDEKYGASAANVWRKKRFIVNKNGAPCSKALKRDVLNAFRQIGDSIVLGYTADTRDAARLDRYLDANPQDWVIAPLVEEGLTKQGCFDMVTAAGIDLPLMYRLGYQNANCPKCPKGGMGYWNRIRITHPENFEEMAQLQDLLGPGSYFFRDRETGERISLRMLDPNAGRLLEEPSFECGAICELPDSPKARAA